MRWIALAWLVLLSPSLQAADAPPDMPAVPREFRGLWVATVNSMDWPTRGASTDQQKQQLIAILDKAVQLKMNAIIFQVRPSGDAFYASGLEPWSEFLTGTMGKAPSPFYDPLQFAIDECHKRGLELHAWFNPFRARFSGAKSPPAPTHLGITRPDLVKPYGRQQWMDPGEPEVRRHSLAVFLDVVKRYDVDGIHVDDYFYPYKERNAQRQIIPFPDDASWAKYRAGGGRLGRDDWRRNNIDTFVEAMYKGIKALKPWVKVGISPFGIWRTNNPPAIQGLDPYVELYADSRKWLRNGWLDYFTPQLYWAAAKPHQSYPVLLNWWTEQNTKHRNLWPGNILSHPAAEIANQIALTRKQKGATGNVFFSARTLLANRGGATDAIARAYSEPALVPPSPWLDPQGPQPPALSVDAGAATWTPAAPGWLWVVRARSHGAWTTAILPADQTSRPIGEADVFTVTAVDRCGLASTPAVWRS